MITDIHYDSKISRLIEEAILEDLGMGDLTTDAIVPANAHGYGEIKVKEAGIIAGLDIAAQAFQFVDPGVELKILREDGTAVDAETLVASVEGPLAGILKAERTALNILQRMSGIATLTRKFVRAVEGTRARITDTRKTPPGLRILDKLAVKLGGGVNHRFGLDEMVLIKGNHIVAAGGIGNAIERTLRHLREGNRDIKVEVETRNVEEVKEALKLEGIHRIMLDNFSVREMKQAVEAINGRVEIEASGNVSLENVRAIAETGVDFISVGALTHSPKALDISLKILPTAARPHNRS